MLKQVMISVVFVLLPICLLAQGITVKGKVTDKSGPLPGVSIVEKGTTNGVTTDIDGQYVIRVASEAATLQFSFVGFATQEVKATQGVIDVVMEEDTKQLDEVVVVGFGVQKKVNLTGAVSPVNMGETLGNRPLSSITQALQGAVPGLKVESSSGTPGDGMSYNIRGTTSINGGSPLVLVNNVPMDINMIDPQDIESVSVLKDAASAAIYGARAAFGVILITTKQGKKEMAPKFNYNNNFSFSKPTELPQKAHPLEFVQAIKQLDWPNNSSVDGKDFTKWEAYINDYNANPDKYPGGYVWDEGIAYFMRNNDMFKDMTSDFGFMQNHSFSVQGGSERTNYRMSLGYTGEDGILITDKDKFKRLNVASFLSTDVNKWLTTQVDFRYANSNQSKPENGGRNGVWGSAMQLPSYHNILPYEYSDGVVYPPETSATYIRYGEPRVIKKKDLRALGRVIISPLKGLKLTGEYTYNRTETYNRMYTNKYDFIGFNFTGILHSTENSSYALTQSFTNYNAVNIFGNYDLTIGRHDISVMAGFNQEESHSESQWSKKTDVLLENLPSLSGSTGTAETSDSFNEYAVRGGFFRVNYAFAGKYLFEANGRYDGSSRFPKDDRFGFFPSFSLGWRLSEEKFMKVTEPVLSNLKLRASWGTIGNGVILFSDGSANNYPYVPSMSVDRTNWLVDGQKPTTMYAPAMVSQNLTWEKVYTLDFGVDFGLFDNRLTGTFDWYRRNTRGMLAPGIDFPWVVGTSAPDQNAANLRTYGWELEMKWSDRIGKDWSYHVGFNLYDSQSEITKFRNETNLLGTYRNGMKIGEIWGYTTDRFYTESDFDGDGNLLPGIPKPNGAAKVYPGDVLYKNFDDDEETIYSGEGTADNPGDRRIIGNNTPRYMYGIHAGVTWKGLDFSVFFRGVGKRDFWRTDQMAWPDADWGTLYKETLNFWRPDNKDAYYPRAYANNKVNTNYNRWVQTKYLADASYLKLQNITLTYTLPKNWVNAVYLDDVKVFFSGENLYTWHHLSEGLDPDMLNAGSWRYPFMRKFSIGLNVTF